ncbi:TPA: hypothetical protein EYP12_09170 [Candidatus Bipolaricaulota bacterium]|nr:hypothetical protein [Candidatus Bipolaricaulota bacterium]
MIVKELLESVAEPARGRRVVDVRIGLGYTAVKLDDNSCGLAGTPKEELSPYCHCTAVREAGSLAGREALSLAEWALSPEPLASALGIATINALLSSRIEIKGQEGEGDILEHLPIKKDDIIGMVGHFGPLVEPLRRRCKRLYIFERRFQGQAAEGLYPDWAAELLLPQCTVAIITGTTLVNKTIDHLLELCRGPRLRLVALAGATTPLSPLFARYGVSHLFGVRVRDPARLLKVVSEGGGTPTFGDAVTKVAIELTPAGRASRGLGGTAPSR